MHNLDLYGKTVIELKKDNIKNLHIYKNQSSRDFNESNFN